MDYKDLKGKHEGKDCVIFTCGPSLREYDRDMILKFCEDKIVICVKEAVIEFKDECDYFFYNDTRPRSYEFNEKTIKIYQSSGKTKDPNSHDIILKEDVPFHKDRQILRKKNFDDYNLENNYLRQWGPGILYESVFYVCLYMGIENVYTIGWDLTDGNGSIDHFFDNDKNKKYSNSKRWTSQDVQLYGFDDEMIMVNQNIPYMYDYFKDKGLNIIVCGEQSHVNRHIPRISLS